MSFQNCKVVGVGVVPDAYHSQKAPRGSKEYIMSPSAINAFARLPSRWVRGWESPESPSKDWGSLVDCLFLTPDAFPQRYAIEPGEYPCEPTKRDPRTSKPWNNNANYCDAWVSEQEAKGLHVVKPSTLERARAAVARLVEPMDGDDTIARWRACCDTQVHVTGEWHDEETGIIVPVQCLLDFVPRDGSEFTHCLGDLKCVRSAHPLIFQRQAEKFGWHRQAAWDMDLYVAATGEDRNSWVFLLSENEFPWEPGRALYSQEADMGNPGFVELGRKTEFAGYEYWLALYSKCLKTGRWPGYSSIGDSVQGWCLLRPEPFTVERAAYAPRFELAEDELEAEETEEEMEIVP